MKLTVVAATGGIGRHLLDQALVAGHDVTAVVRDPRSLPGQVRVVTVADLAAATRPYSNPRSRGRRGALRPGAAGAVGRRDRLAGDAGHGRGDAGDRGPRIVVVSAAPVSTVASPGRPNPPRHDPGDGLVTRHLMMPLLVAALREVYDDLALMEDASGQRPGLDRGPAPRLTDRPLTGAYRTANGGTSAGASWCPGPTSPT